MRYLYLHVKRDHIANGHDERRLPHRGYAEINSNLFRAAFPIFVRGCFFTRCASTSSAMARPGPLVSASAKPVA